MGDFTTRFDAEILRSRWARLDAEEHKRQLEKAEVDRIDRMLDKIDEILQRRAGFVAERFGNAERVDADGPGFRFRFDECGSRRAAVFGITARIKESRMAILVESRFEVPGLDKVQYDYVTLPTARPDIARAQRFIESKLFDFAREYVGS